jgi:hypothetical protein
VHACVHGICMRERWREGEIDRDSTQMHASVRPGMSLCVCLASVCIRMHALAFVLSIIKNKHWSNKNAHFNTCSLFNPQYPSMGTMHV